MIPQMARLLAGLFVCSSSLACATPVSLERACGLLGGKLRSVGVETCLHSGLRLSSISSVRGQPLLYRDYPARSQRGTPYRVLLVGGIHGDELSSVSIVFNWMSQLRDEKFQPFQWRVLPCLNPDGVLASPATRVNANGVDLNRNFPTLDWSADALRYWKTKTGSDPRRYPGSKALSEPESRGVIEMIKAFHPDVIVSVHAPYGVLDFDGPQKPPERFGYLHLQLLGTYPGSLGNFAGMNLSLPVITLELPNAGLMPTPAQSQRIWSDMLTWLEKNLPRHAPPLYRRLENEDWLTP
jgi:protein MpaA